MQIMGVDHIQLAMPPGGEQQARVFYGTLLGFPEIPKPDALARRGGCWFRGPGIDLHLGIESPFTPARKAHPAFLVADLAASRAHLAQANVPTVPDDAVPGVRRFYADDPFGNRIEFIQAEDGFSRQE